MSLGSVQPTAAPSAWRLDRVSFADRRTPLALEFHPNLNVVVTSAAAVASAVRRLAGVLHEGDGTHVELSVGAGSSPEWTPLVVFRPFGGRHRLIELSSGVERPLAMLASLGPCAAEFDESDDAVVELVRDLCRLEQGELWAAAERVVTLRDALAQGDGDDRGVVDGGVVGGGVGGDVTLEDRATSFEAQRTGIRRGLLRRRGRSEAPVARSVLEALGAADQRWRMLAGAVSAETALCHRDRAEVAQRLLARIGALAAVGSVGDAALAPVDPADAVRATCALVPERRNDAGPHIVAVPGAIDHELASLLLDHLAMLSGARQIIVVTSDDGVVDWARLESHARRAALLSFE